MIMKKFIILFALCALSFISANAVVYQRITLKNGSVLNGFVQQQDGAGNMLVNTDNAMICVKNLNVSVSDERNVEINTLSEQWKEWAEKNDYFSYNGSEKVLKLRDIKFGIGKLDTISRKKMIGFEARMHEDEKSFLDVFLIDTQFLHFLKSGDHCPACTALTWQRAAGLRAQYP